MKGMNWLHRLRSYIYRHRRSAIIIAAILLVVITIQFLYPRDRMLPFVRLDDVRIGSSSQAQTVQYVIDHYSNVPVTLKIAGPAKKFTHKTTTTEIGLVPDTERIVYNLKNYPWWERLVPFSLIVKGLTTNEEIVSRIDAEKFKNYADIELKACAVQPANASVAVKDGAVVLVSAKEGQKCNQEALEDALSDTPLVQKGITTQLSAETIKPTRSDKDVSGLLKDATALTDNKIVLNLEGSDYAVSKATLAAWLVFADDPKTKKITVDVGTTQIREYLNTMQSKIYIAPGTTKVQTLDGNETSRTEGVAGRGFNFTATADALKKQVLAGDGTVKGELVTLPSRVVYERSYTATRAGLQALLNDLVTDKGDYGISVRLLDGSVISANGTKRYHPASTYKMYVAYSLLKRIASGEIKWEDTATAGKNISQCFDVMIVNSDNTCAEWLGDKIGWSNINNEVKAIGLANTNTIRGAMYSTADDETLFLMKLQNGTILGATERDRLLDVMKRQVYRSGIPAGVGVTVADKVGFLDGKLHDAAIVYGKQTYALTIMSYGSSWAQIADAARQINAQLARM